MPFFALFLNEIDFSDKSDNDQLDKIKQIGKTIVTDVEDVNLTKMIHTLIIIDDIEMSYVVNIDDIDYRAERTQSLRSNIVYLLNFKRVVDGENKKDNSDFLQIDQ